MVCPEPKISKIKMTTNIWSHVLKVKLWTQIFGYFVVASIIILNIIEIWILGKKKKRKAYERLLLSLSVCDLLGGFNGLLFAAAAQVANATHGTHLSLLMMILWGFNISFGVICSVFHLALISLDRMWAVAAPFHHIAYTRGRQVLF